MNFVEHTGRFWAWYGILSNVFSFLLRFFPALSLIGSVRAGIVLCSPIACCLALPFLIGVDVKKKRTNERKKERVVKKGARERGKKASLRIWNYELPDDAWSTTRVASQGSRPDTGMYRDGLEGWEVKGWNPVAGFMSCGVSRTPRFWGG